MPIEVASGNDTLILQPTNQRGNHSTIQTNCKQTLRNQPNNMTAKQLTIETFTS